MPEHTTWEIQRKELYESAGYLNKNHLPLELGDIFVRTETESRKHYILLAQPCDLMVRSDGERHPDFLHFPVAEIVNTSERPPYSEEMEYFEETPNAHWYVKLKQAHQVRACILDLCTFNDDGSATVQLEGEAPSAIRPAWKAHYGFLAKSFGGLLRKLDVLFPVEGDKQEMKQIKEKLRSTLMGELLNEGLFKGMVIEKDGRRGIAYNFRRVGRLSRAQAFGLLIAYTGFLSRPAYDRSFG